MFDVLMDHVIDVARGNAPADLLLKNAQVVNVFNGEVYATHVAIAGEWIAGVGDEYNAGKEIVDLHGLFLLPGLINGHLHLESSMLTPAEYGRLALARGTTTIVLDPHEIANVLGIAGIQALLNASKSLPLDYFFMAPSCVPATPLETSGAVLSADSISMLLRNKRVLGLGEMMNFPGVLAKDPEVLKKIEVARNHDKSVDGHAPLLSGRELNAYMASGIDSDHECSKKEEAEEKLRLGIWVMIREGSAARNLDALLPLVTPKNSHRCLFVLDDLEAADLIDRGEMDGVLRKAVARGLDPITAVQMATIHPAQRFCLRDRGAIGPGKRADLVAASNLHDFSARLTIKNGKVVSREGKTRIRASRVFKPEVFQTIRIKPLEDASFQLRLAGDKAWVIGLIPDQILTQKTALPAKKDDRGMAVSDPESDILKIAVIERHKASGNIGLGLVKGFGLKRGALAASVAHDSHNIIVVGVADEDMRRAVEEIEKMQGGLVVVDRGQVMASLALPLAGLMSLERAEIVDCRMEELHNAAREIGAVPSHPFLTLSFLALPVIPELKLTDRGLVDVAQFRVIPLEA